MAYGMRRKSMRSKSEVIVRTAVICLYFGRCFFPLILSLNPTFLSQSAHSIRKSSWTGLLPPSVCISTSVTPIKNCGNSERVDRTSWPKGGFRLSNYKIESTPAREEGHVLTDRFYSEWALLAQSCYGRNTMLREDLHHIIKATPLCVLDWTACLDPRRHVEGSMLEQRW